MKPFAPETQYAKGQSQILAYGRKDHRPLLMVTLSSGVGGFLATVHPAGMCKSQTESLFNLSSRCGKSTAPTFTLQRVSLTHLHALVMAPSFVQRIHMDPLLAPCCLQPPILKVERVTLVMTRVKLLNARDVTFAREAVKAGHG